MAMLEQVNAMEAQDRPRDLGSRERNDLRDSLLAWNAPQLAQAYEAAVALLGRADFPARRHLLAHLVRDIANRLPEVVTGDKVMRFETTAALDELVPAWRREVPESSPLVAADAASPTTVVISPKLAAQVSRLVSDHKRVNSKRGDHFALLMEALRPGSQALRATLEPIIREWLELVRWFVGHAHVPAKPTPAPDEAELERRFRRFEDGLRGILAGHFQVTQAIDEILATGPPGAETLARLMPLLGGAQQLHHFFERIEDPAWLEPLARSGLLSCAPAVVVHESDAGRSLRYPGWPAAKFLMRQAGHEAVQERVAEVANAVQDADNPWVHHDLAEIALRLQPRCAARLVRKLITCLETSDLSWSHLDDRLGALAAHLAGGGERSAALLLLRKLTGKPVRTPRGARATIDAYNLRRILRRDLPAIVGGLGLEVLSVVCRALDAEMRAWNEDQEHDRSEVWRPAVEGNGRFSYSTRDVLVSAVVQSGELCVATGAATLPEVVEQIEGHRRWIFRRIALYLLASTPDAPDEWLTARLLDRGLFDAFDRAREYRLLLQRGFARLTIEAQQRLLAWIEVGLDRTELRGLLERWIAHPLSDEDVAQAHRRWQWRRLAVVQADLGPDWRGRLTALEQEFGSVQADAALDLSVWPVRDETPSARTMPDEVVRTLPPVEIAAHLRVAWAERSRRAAFVSEFQLEQRVMTEPQRDAEHALAFKVCPPEVLVHLFSGLQRALHARRSFGWRNVLSLASWVLEEARAHGDEVANEARDSLADGVRAPTAWGYAQSAVVALLETALRMQAGGMTLDDRAGLWRLLDALARSRAAATRARSVDLIAYYRSWLEVATREAGAPLATAPEVTKALSAILDDAPVREVHESFGRRMDIWTLCEGAWVRRHLDRVFPSTDPVRFEAVWGAYLDEHTDYAGAVARRFELLRGVYVTAVETMELPAITGRELLGGTEPARAHAETLARDLLTLYGQGVIALDDPLLRRLFDRADGRLRLQALYAAGHQLLPWTDADGLSRFRALWCWRRTAIETGASRADELAQELPAFGSWFMWGDFDEPWKLGQLEFVLSHAQPVGSDTDWWEPVRLITDVLRRLAAMAVRMPRQTVHCLDLLARRLKSSAQLSRDEVKTILGGALRSGDARAQAQAIATYHRLGELGFRAHELLPFSEDLDDPAAIAYFTWDDPMTVAEIRKRLVEDTESEQDRMLGRILREARDTDAWKFTTPAEVDERWPRIERHLGKRRAFWASLLAAWREQGLLAG